MCHKTSDQSCGKKWGLAFQFDQSSITWFNELCYIIKPSKNCGHSKLGYTSWLVIHINMPKRWLLLTPKRTDMVSSHLGSSQTLPCGSFGLSWFLALQQNHNHRYSTFLSSVSCSGELSTLKGVVRTPNL